MDLFFLFQIFVLGGIVGWILDTIYRSMEAKRYSEASAWHVPFLPIYGLGAVLLVLVNDLLPESLLMRFFTYAMLLGALEYFGGVFTLAVFKKRLWDYSDARFNLHGHTDLWHMFLWGLLGLAFTLLDNHLSLQLLFG